MYPEYNPPTHNDIEKLNSMGFSQWEENSWFFFKLGYVFDFSSIAVSYANKIFENRFISPFCLGSVEHFVLEQISENE